MPRSNLIHPPANVSVLRFCAATWGLGGFLFFLIYAIHKLFFVAVDALDYSITLTHWLLLLGNLVFMGYSEGYKGFQKSYSPRLAARARFLAFNRSSWQAVLLAPLFCMGFFHAPKRRIVSAVLLSLMIVVLILCFRLLPQPWRGILDAGVVFGLSWGFLATAYFGILALRSKEFDIDPEVAGIQQHSTCTS